MGHEKLVVPSRSVFAAVLLRGTEEGRRDVRSGGPTVVDLTRMIVGLKTDHDLDTSDISIRADKGGWTSDDLSSFLNGFVLFGLATQNPVTLAADARLMCEDVLKGDGEEYPEAISRLIEALGVRLPAPETSAGVPASTAAAAR
jgi:hypothetical protein